jgi:hypothetical protein
LKAVTAVFWSEKYLATGRTSGFRFSTDVVTCSPAVGPPVFIFSGYRGVTFAAVKWLEREASLSALSTYVDPTWILVVPRAYTAWGLEHCPFTCTTAVSSVLWSGLTQRLAFWIAFRSSPSEFLPGAGYHNRDSCFFPVFSNQLGDRTYFKTGHVLSTSFFNGHIIIFYSTLLYLISCYSIVK